MKDAERRLSILNDLNVQESPSFGDVASKAALRQKAVHARNSIPAADREAFSRLVSQRITRIPAFRAARTVLLYRAVRGELSLDTLPLLPPSIGKRFVYPRCLSKTEMAAFLPSGWVTGAFGIPEPSPDSPRVAPGEIDLVICPGTAFDNRGVRLGMGAGYYDRFLPLCKNAVVGIAAFEAQHVPLLPASLEDVLMDFAVTERDLYLL